MNKADKLTLKGQKVYEKIKDKYEPKYNGKYLVIEPDSSKAFMGDDAANTMVRAEKKFPNKQFFVLKIGYVAAFSSVSPILLPNK